MSVALTSQQRLGSIGCSKDLKALPTLESWKRIAQRVRDPGHGGLDLAWPLVVESVDSAEEKPVGHLTQHQQERILSNISHLTLGGEA